MCTCTDTKIHFSKNDVIGIRDFVFSQRKCVLFDFQKANCFFGTCIFFLHVFSEFATMIPLPLFLVVHHHHLLLVRLFLLLLLLLLGFIVAYYGLLKFLYNGSTD